MEKRISNKIEGYFDEFKQNIKSIVETNDNISFSEKSNLLKYIFDYNNLTLTKEDFCKRKRTKSIVPHYLRCMAKRSCGEQCTRKRKENSTFCGTHDKNRPHGVVDSESQSSVLLKKREVWLQEINGIIYYIDDNNNVYKTEDILENTINPNIIAKYTLIDGEYKFLETYN